MGIWLDPIPHVYINDEKPLMKYTSVTTVLGKYHEKFDEQFWSLKIAERDGKTQAEVLAEWKKINEEANIYGTMVHEILERYLLSKYRMYSPVDDFEKRVIAAFVKCCNENALRVHMSSTLHPERIMSLEFTETQGMAGTSDIIEDIHNNKFNVWDFKTNRRFRYYNQSMMFPIEHLVDCEFNAYAMQLSMYGVMYERETGKVFNRAGLFYWDKINEFFTLINVNYLKLEAIKLIEHFKIKSISVVNG
jgi:hypothetical protein